MYKICCTLDEISNISPPRPLILPTLSNLKYFTELTYTALSKYVLKIIKIIKIIVVTPRHRRRINKEGKAKFVAASWGTYLNATLTI